MTEQLIEGLLKRMTVEEQVSLLAGADFWSTVPVSRLDIPAIKVTDGPNGARGGGSLIGGVSAAAFPVAIALASTWNTALVEQIGQALAAEAQSKGARVLLAPTVNLHRSPLNGRNFECYSEDPFLSAELAVAYIRGVQSKGVAATIKHYIGNESEFERHTISSQIGERALRELYLLPFEAAVKQSGVWALMAAYNKVNGTYASEHPRLLTEILRREWGFDGVVMSDWFATHITAEALNAGLDLEMPGPARLRGERLVAAVREGQVSAEAVRESARRLLRLIARVGAFDDPTIAEEQAIDRPEHRALIRQAGAQAIVLLKNDGVLPLDRQALRSIAIIGPNAKTAQIMGGGSAQLNPHYAVSPLEGVAAQIGDGVTLTYEQGCTNHKQLPLLPNTFSIEYYNSRDLSGEAVHRAELAGSELMWLPSVPEGVDPAAFSARLQTTFTPEQDGEHHFGLVSAGHSRLLIDGRLVVDNWDSWQSGSNYFGSANDEVIGAIELQAGQSYTLTVEYASPAQTNLGLRAIRIGAQRPLGDEEIERAAQTAAGADVALVFVGLNGQWDTEGADRQHMDLVGRQNELIERVAQANPRTVVVLQTGGPVTMPWLEQAAAVLQAWYPGQECGNAIADVLFGAVNPAGRLPQTFPRRLEDNPAYLNYPGENGRVHYGEGIFIGYRYYEKKRIAPLFPFGYGLSYTSFAYGNLRMSGERMEPNGELTITVDVTNTGRRAGDEVVQLYIRDPEARLTRPEKELKGFARVRLQPGETAGVNFKVGPRALAYFDDGQMAWVAEAGEFEVLIGGSSQDIRAQGRFHLTESALLPV